ncbi:hypothetical protein BDW62DRAFT_194202 [Aspergillus aurantiobrunneus]
MGERRRIWSTATAICCYTVKWKLLLINKPVGIVTEKALVVVPSQFWEKYLKADLDNMVQTKRKPN